MVFRLEIATPSTIPRYYAGCFWDIVTNDKQKIGFARMNRKLVCHRLIAVPHIKFLGRKSLVHVWVRRLTDPFESGIDMTARTTACNRYVVCHVGVVVDM